MHFDSDVPARFPLSIAEALANQKNPGASISNHAQPVTRGELANILALLILNIETWRQLGNEAEVAQRIGQLINSF
jgi:hypothetical protein